MSFGAFLAGAAKEAGNTLIQGATNKLVNKLFGTSPAEANRQSISNTNNFLSGTWETRAATDKAYMDAVYPGTSPWERLGTSSAAPIQSSDPGTSREAAMMPFLTAQIAARSQQKVADTQQKTALGVAEINAQTERYKSDQSTNSGQLGISQTALNAAKAVTEEYQQMQLSATSQNIYNQTLMNRARTFFDMLPKESIDFGAFKAENRPGWDKILAWLETKDGPQSNVSFDALVKSMPRDQWTGVLKDIAQMAGGATKLAKAGAEAAHAGIIGRRFLKGFNH